MTTVNFVNLVNEFDGFHISYWVADHKTAMVFGQSQLFISLKGNHLEALTRAALEGGKQACIDYFIENMHDAAPFSKHLRAYSNIELLGDDNRARIAEKAAQLEAQREPTKTL